MPDPRETPAMQQYYRFKKRHPDCVLLFRIGDFYELFDDDAVKVSQAIGLTLTQRTAGVPMCGMPFHQLDVYLKRLTTRGFRVAICEQLIDASLAKGVVPRAVTRVITPGTLVDESLLEGEASVALASVVVVAQGPGASAGPRAAMAIADVATGAFHVVACPLAQVVDEVARRCVKELLFADAQGSGHVPDELKSLSGLHAMGVALVPRPSWHFRPHEALDCLRKHYQVATLAGFGLQDDDEIVGPAGALLAYLQETQTSGEEESREAHAALRAATSAKPRASSEPAQDVPVSMLTTPRRGSLRHLSPPRREDAQHHLVIDATSLRSLEVERTMRDGPRGPLAGSAASSPGVATDPTLVGVFFGAGLGKGTPRTAMGKRALREWICRPLRDLPQIASRQDAIALLSHDSTLATNLGSALGDIQDIARIAGRVSLARATPRDLVGLAKSVLACEQVARVIDAAPALAPFRQPLASHLAPPHDSSSEVPPALALARQVLAWCVDDPPPHLREGGLIREGIDTDLDEARLLERDASAWLASYQAQLIQQHKLPSLRVGYNKVAGYFIELPEAQAKNAPPELKRMQTLRNVERFTSHVLSDFERKVTTAQARALERERELFQTLCDQALARVDALAQLGQAIAAIDVLLALGDKASHRGWVRPSVVPAPVLHIRQGRHPVLDEVLGECVPNDCDMGMLAPCHSPPAAASESAASLALITGPNMAGKSTYIRMVALLTILAHVGSFVPAQAMEVGLTDRVFTRIGADDALHAGQSTFMVEMVETAQILHHATPASLIVLDEVGRGTSTLDGLSLAWAIVEYLAHAIEATRNTPAQGPRTLFATHYHELTELEDRLPGRVRNLHVEVREWPQGDDHAEIVFLHRIVPGRTDQSYGLHVARLAGMPKGVVGRAREVLGTLAVHEAGAGPRPNTAYGPPAASSSKPTKRAARARMDVASIAPPAGHDDAQLTLFREFVPHPAVDALKDVKLDHLTPLQAFDELRRLRDMADAGHNP